MVLVVEDGTGLSNSDSYGTIAEADAYLTKYGGEYRANWSTRTVDEKEESLLQGVQSLELIYGSRWVGVRGNKDQALGWPRVDAYTNSDESISSSSVPNKVLVASFEFAARFAKDGALLSDSSGKDQVTRETLKLGTLSKSVEYRGEKSAGSKYSKVDQILQELLEPQFILERS